MSNERIMTQPWEKIHEYYSKLAKAPEASLSIVEMCNLVGRIKTSRYAPGIHGWTSMSDLKIVQTEVSYPYDGPFLWISLGENGKLNFRYVDSHFTDEQWHRTAEKGDGFRRLERFFEQLHWFTSAR